MDTAVAVTAGAETGSRGGGCAAGAPDDGWRAAAVVFDFDGVIVDTEATLRQAWAEQHAAHGVPFDAAQYQDAFVARYGASGYVDLLAARVGDAFDEVACQAARRAREAELAGATALLPGVQGWLAAAAAAQLPCAIATGSPRFWVQQHLDRLGLAPSFAVVVSRDDVEHGKPDPALFRVACQALGVDPATALAVEDAPHGVAAARAAGLRALAVPCAVTVGLPFPGAQAVVPSLADPAAAPARWLRGQ